MNEITKEKLRQTISRTDKTGNEKLELLIGIMNQHTLSIVEKAVEDERKMWGEAGSSSLDSLKARFNNQIGE